MKQRKPVLALWRWALASWPGVPPPALAALAALSAIPNQPLVYSVPIPTVVIVLNNNERSSPSRSVIPALFQTSKVNPCIF
jgi:hypothetical protein